MPRKTILLPPPEGEFCSGADLSVVSLAQVIRGSARIFARTSNFSATINAGARSALTNITAVVYYKICIVGVAVSSEFNTNWRIKFYRRDTGAGVAYDNNTFSGALEIASLTPNANNIFEGEVEASLFYEDADSPTGSAHEIHVIMENMGAVNSKVLLTLYYTEAD